MNFFIFLLLFTLQALAKTAGYDVVIKNTTKGKESSHKLILKPGIKKDIKIQEDILSVTASDTEDEKVLFEMELRKDDKGRNMIKARPMIVVSENSIGSITTPDYSIAISAKRLKD